jgi:peroxiredoxin/uncharacterized membrane protein YphA (DoxX/SURF4 family)
VLSQQHALRGRRLPIQLMTWASWMDILLLLCRILIAGVLCVSGLAKLADVDGTRKGLLDFGVPQPLIRPLGIILPLAEIITAILLLPLVTAWFGAVLAFILFSIFTISIAANLWRGKRPVCSCFGQLHKQPISEQTLLRNLLLLLITSGLVWFGRDEPGLSILAWRNYLSPVEQLVIVALTLNIVLISGLSFLLFLLWHQQGRLLTRIEFIETALSGPIKNPIGFGHSATNGHPIGSAMPDFDLKDISGRTVRSDELLAPEQSLMIIFVDPNCGPCNLLLPTVSHWERTMSATLRFVIVSRGNTRENSAKMSQFNLTNYLLQTDQDVSSKFGVELTPSAVLISPDGHILSALMVGVDAISELVTQAAATSAAVSNTIANAHNLQKWIVADTENNGRTLGQTIPQLNLLDLDGQPLRSDDFQGHVTLIILWDLSCRFCIEMLPKLRAAEIFSRKDSPHLLLASSGDRDSNRSMGLKARVILDDDHVLARQFGVKGTPSGVLVDANGMVASKVIVGASAILEFLRNDQKVILT